MLHKVFVSGLIVMLGGLLDPTARVAAADEAGFKPIFDGKTLNGWDGDPALWRVEDGAITGQTTPDTQLKTNTFIIWRQGEVDDFELRFEYRIFGGNSGVQYRSREEPDKWGKWVVGGYQGDFEAGDKYSGILYEERGRGILAERGERTVVGDDHKKKVVAKLGDAKELGAKVRKEDWNSYHIVARANHIQHSINGQIMVEVTDDDAAERCRSGILAFQLHVGPPMKIQVRDVRLKRLPMEGKKKIVLVAGPASHNYGSHEHYAGCRLLADALNAGVPEVHAAVYRDGWPADPTAFDNADAVVIYCDGGGGHVVMKHLDETSALAKKGVGVACLHYATEIPKGDPGNRMLDWIGGYFELNWSVNPFWTADFKTLPNHPIARGVKPFKIDDEWYYHLRFRDDMAHVTPILTAVPPDKTREGPDGPRSGNAQVRSRRGMAEHVGWAYERPGGGRGFGCTGGHIHWNWANDQYRKVILNALVWVAGAEVPREGVPSTTPTLEQLEANLDEPRPDGFDRDAIRRKVRSWN